MPRRQTWRNPNQPQTLKCEIWEKSYNWPESETKLGKEAQSADGQTPSSSAHKEDIFQSSHWLHCLGHGSLKMRLWRQIPRYVKPSGANQAHAI